ncbi:MAG TPA: PAS domain-containing protein, partial [Nitrospira sp.]|nr:PAS domain-containing protein [Nitrospira sp.]
MKALRALFVHPLPPLAGLLSLEVGGLVLFGWAVDSADLKSLAPGLIPMMPNAAIAFLLIGVSLVCASIKTKSRMTILRLTAGASAALTAAVGLATSLEYLLGMNFGIDQWLFHDPLQTVGPWMPGRIGLNTAACFFLLGTALFLKIRIPRWHHSLSDACTLAAMLLAFMAFLGYLYHEEFLYGVGRHTPMALHTALTLLLVCAGALALHPDRGVMAVVTSDQAGGYMLRRLLPVVFIVLPAMGWVRLYGERQGFYGTAMGVAIFASAAMVTLAGLLGWTARSVNHMDRARRQSDRLFAAFMDNLPALAWIKDAQGRYLHINEAFARAFGGVPEEWRYKRDRDMLPALTAAQFESNDARVIETQKAVVTVETAPYVDGIHESLVSKFPICDEVGRLDFLGGVAFDVTERKRIESALRESDERFRQVTEHIQEVFWLSDTLKNEVLYISPAYELIWGRSCES